ncbi:MAG: AraC family transcriptional regulator, partial [Clostridiales bacterium]|nr:AraC family transcriptional regulator [Clostridiales bacterium]
MKDLGAFTPTELEVTIDVSQIITIHYIKYSRDFAFTGERHDFWEMVYVDKGETGALAEAQGFNLKEGEAIFHKPGEYHNIWAQNKYANVAILTFVCESPAVAFFENKLIAFNETEKELLARILSTAKRSFDGPLDEIHQKEIRFVEAPPFACRQVLKNYVELLLISLIQNRADTARQNRASDSAKRQGENTIVESVRQILSENLYNDISLNDIMEKVCFSKSYLTRLYRVYTGESIMEDYINMKISEAQRLISERVLSFSEIADRLNFGS